MGALFERVRDVDVLMKLGRVSLLAGFALGVAAAGLAETADHTEIIRYMERLTP